MEESVLKKNKTCSNDQMADENKRAPFFLSFCLVLFLSATLIFRLAALTRVFHLNMAPQ